MAGNRSSWRESGQSAGNGPFDRATVAPLLDALHDPLESVRTGALRALVRLPLADQVWLEVGEFIGPLLAAPIDDPGVGISRLELIQAAIYVPMREMRELLHRLVDEGAPDERLEAARGLALARDPYGASQLLAELANEDPLRQRAGAEALAMLPSVPVNELPERYRQPLDGDARFWLVVALARSGDAEAVRTYLLDLDAGRVEEPFIVVTSGQPLHELISGGSGYLTLPYEAGKAAAEVAASGNVAGFPRQIAESLARASLAADSAWLAGEATAEIVEPSPPAEELARLRDAALALANRYLEASPFSGQEAPSPEDWQLLGHLPPDTAARLVTAFFARLSRQVAEGNDGRATEFGNAIMGLPDDLWKGFVPDLPSLLASYATLKEHYSWGPAEQLAWVVSRAGLRRLLDELAPRLSVAGDGERVAIVSLLERSICYARWDHRPLFGGGSGAADVLPPENAFLERSSQLESASPDRPGGEEVFVPMEPPAQPPPRRIQGKVLEVGEPGPDPARTETLESRAFRAGGDYRLDVWIGPLEAGAIVAPAAFPEDLLPSDLETYELKVLFWETRHMPEAQVGTIILPRLSGKSTLSSFRFKVRADLPDFEGRLEVLYGSRILQTVILTGLVVRDPAEAPAGAEIAFRPDTPVRASLIGLDNTPPRGATIFADTPTGQPVHITAVAEKRVALRSLEGIDRTIQLIRGRLEQIAEDPGAFTSLDEKATQDLLRFFARQGRLLYNALVQTYLADFPLDENVPIQLVSARESFLPLEFIYDRPAPSSDATLCSGATEALSGGKCTACEASSQEEARKHICPLGFWCTRRIIERHAVRPLAETGLEGAEYAIETDPVAGRNALSVLNSAVYAASSKVRQADAEALAASLAAATNGRVRHVKDWDAWREAIRDGPSMLVLLPHTLRDDDEIPTLEIGEHLLPETDILPDVVSGPRSSAPPVVLLLGCDTAVLDIPFQNFATQFRVSGAAIVLNTLAPVLGRHVVPVAQMLVEELRAAAEAGGTFGSALVAVRRRGLAAGLPVVLSLVAYGDADWGIKR